VRPTAFHRQRQFQRKIRNNFSIAILKKEFKALKVNFLISIFNKELITYFAPLFS